MVSIVLFTRDLRLNDNPALLEAARKGPVLPLCVIDPENWIKSNVSSSHYTFYRESVEGLSQELARLGQALVIRKAPLLEVLESLRKRLPVERLYTRYGCAVWPDDNLDRNVANWAGDHGIVWTRTGAAPLGSAPIPAPEALPRLLESSARAPVSLPLPGDPAPAHPRGDRASALARLGQFIESRGLPRPSEPFHALEKQASRLGPWLSYGVISGREVDEAARAARNGQGQAARQELRRLSAGLARRAASHAARQAGSHAASHAGPTGSSGPAPQPERIALPPALLRGQTGLPFLDAIIRYLASTGWLPESLRTLLIGTAALIPETALPGAPDAMTALMARLCIDHDPWLQAAALEAPLPADPIRAGERLDPGGRLIRRWLPELAALPDSHLHRPWLWPAERALLARRYPEPLFDPATALNASRAARRAAAPRPRTASHNTTSPRTAHTCMASPHTASRTPRRQPGQFILDLHPPA